MSFEIPIVFIIFNRPDTTLRVFEQIAFRRPQVLHVIADGPRPEVPGENELCQKTRKIVQKVDWPCELSLDFSEHNMGCRDRIYSGISNVFKKYESAIILEDDCLPSAQFFSFMEKMLMEYANDPTVMHISGTTFVRPKHPKSLYFRSVYPLIWGWGTWRRVWENFDIHMQDWPKVRDLFRERLIGPDLIRDKFIRRIEKAYVGKINTWGYPYAVHILKHKGQCITPLYNMISNIGFSVNSTHTSGKYSPVANLPLDPWPESIGPPPTQEINTEYSRLQLENAHYQKNIFERLWKSLSKRTGIPFHLKLKRPE